MSPDVNSTGRRPTLRDVASPAGVSVTTASRVINGSRRTVPESNRLAVLDAAAELGYTADVGAQALARARWDVIDAPHTSR
ncbi:LacI family DNA-binding transcriptional regulator [Microbacterium terrae]|uniref:LacI family DNA-binding transcriptional regulator n=1 Tax=Microbacterium terrae TaxID=69369 RepID=UPI0028527C91|nr:LacI family DNA-binding transcriptional regulator [Microbacterium terrae]